MNLFDKLNNPLDYIEENLTIDIDFKEVGRLASCSQCYYKRIFLTYRNCTDGIHPPQKPEIAARG